MDPTKGSDPRGRTALAVGRGFQAPDDGGPFDGRLRHACRRGSRRRHQHDQELGISARRRRRIRRHHENATVGRGAREQSPRGAVQVPVGGPAGRRLGERRRDQTDQRGDDAELPHAGGILRPRPYCRSSEDTTGSTMTRRASTSTHPRLSSPMDGAPAPAEVAKALWDGLPDSPGSATELQRASWSARREFRTSEPAGQAEIRANLAVKRPLAQEGSATPTRAISSAK